MRGLMWDEEFRLALIEALGAAPGAALHRGYHRALPEEYKAAHTADQAVADIQHFGELATHDQLLALLSPDQEAPREARFRLYRRGSSMYLSDVLSVLHSFGVRVADERAYVLDPRGEPMRLYDLGLRFSAAAPSSRQARRRLEDAFTAAWRGECEIDGLNALVVTADLTWRQVSVLRAYTSYLCQVGLRFPRSAFEGALRDHPTVAGTLSALFENRFDPDLSLASLGERKARSDELMCEIEHGLDEVESLEQDQIIRIYQNLIMATTRTSVFQRSGEARAPYLALKLDPRSIDVLPAPRPSYEIFVYAPRFEAVHLRFGRVARGGLRWSDRRDDFRTEVLGLVKSQMVKNAVIVPTGAKGGFVLKAGAGPQEAAACYQLFIEALLDLTDNLVEDVPTPPDRTVRYDDDDSYLVVAADKGTATFSDLANAIAIKRGFWLGDAFASGGSVGYDHKAMGITARGAWESARHAFRELGRDLDTEAFAVVGIGDMSGDVFGNGMSLSRHARLIAAFDHRSIFIDPDPDPDTSYAERRRLFELPRSSWTDYDKSLISDGGGVWQRSAKTIRLSARARAALGIPEDGPERLTPAAVIRAILTAPVDLLFNGGVGTYVKAAGQRHSEVGDKTNDAVRVDGRQLRCRVVCEGGNLGVTQPGRVEYALAGGLVHTDFVDNSAGVNCSDHEVNIKIMLERAIADGTLERRDRDALLTSMTGEVASRVLRDNQDQAMAIGLARAGAARLLPVHRRMIEEYERGGCLDRGIEALPDDEALAARALKGLGLTGPELAVLLAYTKIVVSQALLDSSVPDEPWVTPTLAGYFPAPLRERHASAIREHPLRREIVATRVANEVVNRGGISAVFRAVEETGRDVADVVRAWMVVWDVFDLPALWRAIEDPDHVVPLAAQRSALLGLRRFVDRAVRWLVTHRPLPLDTPAEIARLRPAAVAALSGRIGVALAERERSAFEADVDRLTALGFPAPLAREVTSVRHAFRLLDVVDVADRMGHRCSEVAGLYASVVETLHVDLLLDLVSALPRGDRWQALARMALRSDLYDAVAHVASTVLATTSPDHAPAERVRDWASARATSLARLRESVARLDPTAADLAALSVIVRSVRTA